jgi:uncharacterized protein YuzE
MRISYDKEADALSILFEETTVTTEQIAEGISLEYDAQGKVAGIEILDAMERLGDRDTLTKIIFEGIGPMQMAA